MAPGGPEHDFIGKSLNLKFFANISSTLGGKKSEPPKLPMLEGPDAPDFIGSSGRLEDRIFRRCIKFGANVSAQFSPIFRAAANFLFVLDTGY